MLGVTLGPKVVFQNGRVLKIHPTMRWTRDDTKDHARTQRKATLFDR
jgi:hypothetical protein